MSTIVEDFADAFEAAELAHSSMFHTVSVFFFVCQHGDTRDTYHHLSLKNEAIGKDHA
jgi:hypothetical protein